MSEPYEIVAAPYSVYLADVGTAFPDVDETPAAGWTLLGTSGDLNYNEDGVQVTHEQTLATFRPAGGSGNRKVWRTEEDLKITVKLADLSPDQYAKILNDATVTTVPSGAGTAGTKAFDLQQGLDVALFALLARGVSSVDDSLACQYQVPIVYQSANPAPVGKKGEPALLELEFSTLEDSSDGFGELIEQTEAAS
jgi:hypothetical protein